jgi:CheY-like chemotaxis protein
VVVEDSADIRDLLAELLKQAGHEVACADDGPRGLQTILAFVPDIAFVDLGLPGFDGLELARRARASGSTSRLVAVTGYGQAEDRKHAADAGFDDHLTKPVVDVELSQAILRLDSRRRSA